MKKTRGGIMEIGLYHGDKVKIDFESEYPDEFEVVLSDFYSFGYDNFLQDILNCINDRFVGKI